MDDAIQSLVFLQTKQKYSEIRTFGKFFPNTNQCTPKVYHGPPKMIVSKRDLLFQEGHFQVQC